MKIYLAGSQSDWRKKLKEALGSDIEYLESDFGISAMLGYVAEDLRMIDEADLVICMIDFPVHTGSIFECGYAYAQGKPIITIFELKGRVEPFLVATSIGMYTDLVSSIGKIKRTIRQLK